MNLNLIEALLLIALDDDNGRFITDSGNLRHGISGAVLMELALEGKVEVEGDKLSLSNASPSKSPIVNEILDMMKVTSRSSEVKYWVNKIGSRSQELQEETLASLCEQKILRKEEDKFLWFIRYDIYPAENMNPELEIRKEISDVILEKAKPNPKVLMLLNLIEACDLIREVFHDREEYETAKKRIQELTAEEEVARVVTPSVLGVMTAVNKAVTTIIAATSL